MRREGSPFFTAISPDIHFSSSTENKNGLDRFICYAGDLFKNNNHVQPLLNSVKTLYIEIAPDKELFSFGYFTQNQIIIRESLNEFEKTIVLLVELCNINNTTLLNCLSNITCYSSKEEYAHACECAEYVSLKQAANIYHHGVKSCGWPADFQKQAPTLRQFYILFNMNLQTYLLWSKTPRITLGGQSHYSHYEREYEKFSGKIINCQNKR